MNNFLNNFEMCNAPVPVASSGLTDKNL